MNPVSGGMDSALVEFLQGLNPVKKDVLHCIRGDVAQD